MWQPITREELPNGKHATIETKYLLHWLKTQPQEFQELRSLSTKSGRSKHVRNTLKLWVRNSCNDPNKTEILRKAISAWNATDLHIVKSNFERGRPQKISSERPEIILIREVAKQIKKEEEQECHQKYQEEQKKLVDAKLAQIISEMKFFRVTLSSEDFLLELASRPIWQKLHRDKTNEVILSPNEKLGFKTILAKRKIAKKPREIATGETITEINRWLKNGMIKNVGYRKTSYGENLLIDPNEDVSETRLQQLRKEEAHLLPSQKTEGYWAQTSLLSRGWTKSEISKFLGDPDKEMPNPHYKTGKFPMRLYLKSRVLECEEAKKPVMRKRGK